MKATSIENTLIVVCALVMASVIATIALAEEKEKSYEADNGIEILDVSSYPEEMQANYKTFASKCSKCHTLARPINTDMEAKAWKMYVKRMMNKPDSGISPAQGKRVYKFLKFYQRQKDRKQAKN